MLRVPIFSPVVRILCHLRNLDRLFNRMQYTTLLLGEHNTPIFFDKGRILWLNVSVRRTMRRP